MKTVFFVGTVTTINLLLLEQFCLSSLTTNDNPIDRIYHIPFLSCINAIIHPHFAQGQTVLVSMTNNAFRNNFLQLLFNEELWTIVISTPYVESLDYSYEFQMKHHGYIIFLRGEDEELLDNFITQLEEIKMNGMNPRAKYLVIILDTYHKSAAQAIAEELWHSYGVYDFVILINEELYSWLYFRQDICGDVRVQLIDTCRLQRGVDLYPEKVQSNLYGCPIRVKPIDTPPHLVIMDKKGEYIGMEVAYVEYILKALNATLVYQEIETGDAMESRINTLGALMEGKTDITFGGYPLHPVGISLAEPTISYLGDVLRWYVPCGIPIPRMQKVASIFTISVWLIIALVFLIAVLALRISARTDSYIYKHITGCTYAVWAITLGVSVPEMPKTPIIRTIFVITVWYSFAISTIFQTFFTSILVDPGVTDQISSSEELYKSKLDYQFADELDLFINVSIPEYHALIPLRRVPCTHKSKCLLDYLGSQNIATICFDLMNKFIIIAGLSSSTPEPQLCYLNEVIFAVHFAMYLAQGNPLVRPLNVIIRRLVEAGLPDKVYRDYKDRWRYLNWSDGNVTMNSIYQSNQDIVEYFVFSLRHLQLSFYVLLMGHGTSLLILLAEMLHFYVKK